MADEPSTPRRAEEVVPQAVDMKDEETTRFDDSPSMGKESVSVLASSDHAQRAEETYRMVGRLVGEALELDQIGPDKADRQVFTSCLFGRDLEHGRREVDTHGDKAPACQANQGSAGPTAEIDDSTRSSQVAEKNLFVKLEEPVQGKVTVVFFGDMLGLCVLPYTAGNAGRKLRGVLPGRIQGAPGSAGGCWLVPEPV